MNKLIHFICQFKNKKQRNILLFIIFLKLKNRSTIIEKYFQITFHAKIQFKIV